MQYKSKSRKSQQHAEQRFTEVLYSRMVYDLKKERRVWLGRCSDTPPHMNITIRRLPDAELEVMQAIWACTPPVARTEINDILVMS